MNASHALCISFKLLDITLVEGVAGSADFLLLIDISLGLVVIVGKEAVDVGVKFLALNH